MYNYKLYIRNHIVKEFNMVYVDRYRGLLSIPKRGINIVLRDEYFLSRLFNLSIEELNSYMKTLGLIVEYNFKKRVFICHSLELYKFKI